MYVLIYKCILARKWVSFKGEPEQLFLPIDSLTTEAGLLDLTVHDSEMRNTSFLSLFIENAVYCLNSNHPRFF